MTHGTGFHRRFSESGATCHHVLSGVSCGSVRVAAISETWLSTTITPSPSLSPVNHLSNRALAYACGHSRNIFFLFLSSIVHRTHALVTVIFFLFLLHFFFLFLTGPLC